MTLSKRCSILHSKVYISYMMKYKKICVNFKSTCVTINMLKGKILKNIK